MRNNRNQNSKQSSFFRHNRQIRISPVRLIDQNDEMVGVIPTDQAINMARDAGLDLVEVAPNVRPPVCKILDFGKYKYQQQKKDDKQRAAQRHTSLKEVKIRTTKIDDHDLMIKVDRAKRFLDAGHKVQFGLQYRGREMAHQDIGLDIMDKVKRELFMLSKVEQDFKMQGRRGSMVLAPDKKDAKKIRPPAEGQRITVGTKGVRIDEDGADVAAKPVVGRPSPGGPGDNRPATGTAAAQAPAPPRAPAAPRQVAEPVGS